MLQEPGSQPTVGRITRLSVAASGGHRVADDVTPNDSQRFAALRRSSQQVDASVHLPSFDLDVHVRIAIGRVRHRCERATEWPSRPSRRKAPSASSSSRRPAAKSRPILPCAPPSRAHERMRQPTMEHATRQTRSAYRARWAICRLATSALMRRRPKLGLRTTQRTLAAHHRTTRSWTLHELNHESGLSVPGLQHTLLLLELDGRIRYSSGRVDRVAPRRGIGKGQGNRPAS